MLMVVLLLTLIKVVFNVPFHGNILVVMAGAALCVLSGIGIGTVIATFTLFSGISGATDKLLRESAAYYGIGRDHSR